MDEVTLETERRLLRVFRESDATNNNSFAMQPDFFKRHLPVLLAVMSVCICAHAVCGQTKCLGPEEVKALLAQVNSQQSVSFNKDLSESLVNLKQKDELRVRADIAENKKADEVFKSLKESRERNASELCKELKTYGWPTPALVGAQGVEAAFFLLKNSSPELQTDLLPVVIDAVNKGALPKSEFPGYLDLLRLRAGLKQIFGTQATIKDGFLVLYPIEAEAQVDARRKQFELGPLTSYLRGLEVKYQLPLIRSTGALANSFSETVKKNIAGPSKLFAGQTVDEGDVIRVDTDLVSVNVSVYSNKLRTHVSTLEQKDFTVTEDGHTEALTFFATTDVPFDLVLLLDMSGSTSGKRDVIRESTRRFIKAARPADRLALVTFANDTRVISPLTDDRKKLLKSIDKIGGTGGSNIWGALKTTLDKVLGPKTLARRRAVVLMTDGLDTGLGFFNRGSLSFADLVETIRNNDTLIIPIYLDPEALVGRNLPPADRRMFENARKTLKLLADESGGLYYEAKKIEDLNSVYDQVIEDLGKVYSLGYKPTNNKHDGTWRTVNIAIADRPDLLARARPGYYAK